MYRIRTFALPSVIAIAGLTAAACGSGSAGGPYGQGATRPVTSTAPAAPAPKGGASTSVAAVALPLGNLLVDGDGHALYIFEADTSAAVVGFNLNFNTLAKATLMGLFTGQALRG